MPSVKYLSALSLFCLFSYSALAQPEIAYPGYWQDSFNLRVHINEYLTNVMMSDRQNAAAPLPYAYSHVFRSDMNGNKNLRHVTVQCVKMESDQLLLNDVGPSAVAHRLQELKQFGKLQETTELEYDANGNLVHVKKNYNNNDPQVKHTAAKDYRYMRTTDGTRVIEQIKDINDNRNIKPPSSGFFYSAQYCGTITKGPLQVRDEATCVYDMDQAGRLANLYTHRELWLNNCPNFDSTEAITEIITRDAKGRIIAICDSFRNKGIPAYKRSFIYKDSEGIEDDPLFKTPLMKQYLSTLDHPYSSHVRHIWGYWQKAAGKGFYPLDSPQTIITDYVTVWDADNVMRLSYKIGKEGNEHPVLYTEGADSNSVFRSYCRVNAEPGDTVSAIFDPKKPVGMEMYQTPDRIEYRSVKPEGAWNADVNNSSDRIVMHGGNGWRIIAYGSNAGGDGFFAPMYRMHLGDAGSLKDFIILDPQGIMRYAYYSGNIYFISYK